MKYNLVDIFEVLIALAGVNGIKPAMFKLHVDAKKRTHGAFDNRIILLEVEDDKCNS